VLTALHIAPHPDDELLGAGGTLLRLCDSGWTVVNLACSLGRPADTVRRTADGGRRS
jgi:LmbE family N-acetylglucosaminyl deacetylase